MDVDISMDIHVKSVDVDMKWMANFISTASLITCGVSYRPHFDMGHSVFTVWCSRLDSDCGHHRTCKLDASHRRRADDQFA